MLIYQSEPFAPSTANPIATAIDWLLALLSGSIITSLCVIAIAGLGLLILNGRMPLRAAVRVVVGCFVLLGAPVIAHGLISFGQDVPIPREPAIAQPIASPRPDLPPANYDPYAGASLRQD
ncbi:TrbC/VirB2 family protein [Tsuneonella flava]|uniref:TrbC/VirB2 family protein n=1 Tax=Tsuneonella flava TaxID=2055955 RepID=A0ABX7K8U4_9SPHN|nr:TrbC/VirB2 family protein [Tsuneonella flava]